MDCHKIFMEKDITISQNFLKDPNLVSTLIDQSDITSEDTVVEIGSGRGIITKKLALRCKKVIGVEYDHHLVLQLKNEFVDFGGVEIIEGDFLEWQLPNYQYKVFSNIPFNMTADIVTKLLESENPPQSTYLIIQDKAAGRFIGKPIGKNSQTSILLQPFYNMKILQKIDKDQFSPIPNINAVLAEFTKKKEPLIRLELNQAYRDFIIYGFNQWKPTVLKAFEEIFSYKQLKRIKKDLHLKDMKPTQLDVQHWISLFQIYIQYVPDTRKHLVQGSETRLKSKHRSMQKQYRTRR